MGTGLLEIERKFLVEKPGTLWRSLAVSHTHIQQGYLKCEGATVRVRTRDDKAYLTIKGPSLDGGLSRMEFEKEITTAEAHELLKLCRGGLIDKTRWIVPHGGHEFEVDEFHGDNEGLVFAEVELRSEDEAFDRPAFLGPEVTGNRHFYNSHLLLNPYPIWRDELPEQYR